MSRWLEHLKNISEKMLPLNKSVAFGCNAWNGGRQSEDINSLWQLINRNGLFAFIKNRRRDLSAVPVEYLHEVF